jgi:hypothetical protein
VIDYQVNYFKWLMKSASLLKQKWAKENLLTYHYWLKEKVITKLSKNYIALPVPTVFHLLLGY